MKKTILRLLLVLGVLLAGVNLTPAYAVFEKYISTLPVPATINGENQAAQAELEARVQEVVNLGHLAPTGYFAGLGHNNPSSTNTPRTFYITPNETIYTLSIAYPYLSSGLKTQVKTYLTNEIQSYSPISNGYYPSAGGSNCCKISDWAGAKREYFPVDPNQTLNFFPGISVNASVIYSIWAFSYYTADWTYATSNYNALKSLYTAVKNKGTVTNYPELSGVIGFARIAKQLNQTADYNDALTFTESGFTAGASFTQFLSTAATKFARSDGQPYNPPPVFLFNANPLAAHFNRDIGQFLKDTAASQVDTYRQTLEKNVPLWWITGVGLTWGENNYTTPEYSWTGFMLHAYVLGDKTSQLQKYLDKPDRKGDLFYLQKLVAVIESTPSCQLKYKGDANCDGSINMTDFNSWQQEFNTNPATKTADFNGDKLVNLVDFEIWRSNSQ